MSLPQCTTPVIDIDIPPAALAHKSKCPEDLRCIEKVFYQNGHNSGAQRARITSYMQPQFLKLTLIDPSSER
jgi:hypothetical protein